MNIFDIVVFGVVIISTVLGLYKGLIRLSIGFITFLLSLVSTYFITPMVASAVSEHIKHEIAADITSGIVAYLISMIFFAFLGRQVLSMTEGISGGLIDRLFGLGAGVIRGLIICSILFGIIAIFTSDAYIDAKTAKDVADKIDHAKYPKWLTGSSAYEIINDTSKIIGGMIPDKVLEDTKLPVPEKKLPEMTQDMLDKAAGAAAQTLIEHAKTQHLGTQPQEAAKPSGLEPAPEKHPETKEHSGEDSLDSALKELMGQ